MYLLTRSPASVNCHRLLTASSARCTAASDARWWWWWMGMAAESFTAKIQATINAATTTAGLIFTFAAQHNNNYTHWTSLLSDQHLRGPHLARQQRLSIDICRPRPTLAASPPAAAAAVARRDRQTGRHDTRFP